MTFISLLMRTHSVEGSDSETGISLLCSALLKKPVYTNTGEVQKTLENPYKNKLGNAWIPTDRYYV